MPEMTPRIQTLVSHVTLCALANLTLTSVHHAYGAYVYNSPWRLHVATFAVVAALVVVATAAILRVRPAGAAGTAAFWVFVLAAFGFPFVMIGFFEGGYNHAVKNLLYLGGASPSLLLRLFPPPAYEPPGDLFFEVTGVLQLGPAVLGTYYLIGLLRERWADRRRARFAVAEV